MLGKYEVRGMLGRGAMGTVYDGWDPVIHRRVAIKTVRLPEAHDEEGTEGFARFKREAQAAGRLSHPNIVGVFDYGETADVAFIVMEFVEGRSLKEMLGPDHRMEPQTSVRLMEEVLAALSYSHGRGVVHRDIKPANIMVTNDGRAKIADFGIARIEASSMTQAGTIMGTPAYMSPEQFMGQVVDQRTDIYSCGIMMYQLLTGERPFEGSMASIMHKAMTVTPPRPSELAVTAPARLDRVVARAMARRPEDRFASAAEFAQALRAPAAEAFADDEDATILSQRPEPAAPLPADPKVQVAARPPASTTASGRKNRGPVLAGGGVAVLAAAGVAAWLLLPGSRQAPSPVTAPASPVIAPQASAPPVVVPAVPSALPQAVPEQRQAAAVPAPAVAPQVAPTPPPMATPPASRPPEPVRTEATRPPEPRPEVRSDPPKQTAMLDTPPQGPSRAPDPPPLPPTVVFNAGPKRLPADVAMSLAGSLANVGCTLTQFSVEPDSSAAVTGMAGTGQPEASLRQAVDAAEPARTDWRVRSFDGPFCPAVDVVRATATATSQTLTLEQQGGPAPLLDNQVIALRATMPGFAGFLHVAYLQHDQTVSPLVPGLGYPAQTYPARAVIPLGQKRADFLGWQVGPPFGTDMIVAVASTAPLFARPLPESQPLATYLGSLQAAISDLRRRGGTVAATALVLETRPGR